MTQVSHYLKSITSRLSSLSDTPYLDAQVLIAHIMEKPRSWVLAHPEAQVGQAEQARLNGAMERLERGVPLPYVLGNWDFFGLNFTLTPDVLIPRPETELLVERALDWLQAHPKRRKIADIGTGSGCIAISLGVQIPDALIYAHEISLSALHIAQGNINRYKLSGRVYPLLSDVNAPLPLADASIDEICANLPYIPSHILKNLDVYRHEPSLALEGGQDGLTLIRALFEDAPRILTAGGIILVEIDASQGQAAQQLARKAFPEARVALRQDLAGRDRLLVVDT